MTHRSHISGNGRVRGGWLDRLKSNVVTRMKRLEAQLKQEWKESSPSVVRHDKQISTPTSAHCSDGYQTVRKGSMEGRATLEAPVENRDSGGDILKPSPSKEQG